ncbi:MAG: hypothetical protein ACJA2S_003831 [Cyclobacteriaceae bacterium]|jgi:hypothetical protein
MERREALKKTAMIAGSAAMIPSLFSLLQSCQQQTALDWKPTFLSDDHARLITTLVDTLLPKTGTPGALDMKVHMFMDLVFGKVYAAAGQQLVTAEMTAFDLNCKEKFGDVFSGLSAGDKAAVLKEAEASSPKYNGQVWGTGVGKQEPVGFYRAIKSLALWGYFSSEEIGKNVLSYDPIPGEYSGCILLADVGNTWSL